MATEYSADKIRNVVLLGHSHDGKTMLAEAMLFASGAVARMGSPDQATATTDFEPEEHKRKISITLGVAFAEHNGHKINIIDAPGFFDFAGQVISGLRAAEGVVVVVGPTAQLAVGTEVAWEFCNRSSKPRIVVVNKLDKENSDFYGAVAAMRETLTPRPFPLHLPIGAEQDFRGIVDLLHMKAFVTADDGKGSEVPIPDDMKQRVDEYRGQLIEAAAESDDSLLEKYLDAGTLNEEEIQRGLREGILEGKVAPVVCCSATKLLGVRTLMSTIAELMPPPEVEPDKPVKAFVFSTGGGQFGRVSYFKVVAGTLKAGAHLPNLCRRGDHTEGARRRGEDLERPGPSQRRRSDVARGTCGGDQAAGHRRPGRRAPGCHPREAQAQVRRRGDDAVPSRRLPRDCLGPQPGRGPARQAVRRPRPVRDLRDRGRSDEARRRLRVGGQDLRRGHPAELPGIGPERDRRQHGQGRGRRLSNGRRQGNRRRREIPPGRLQRYGVPDRRLARDPQGASRRRSGSAGAARRGDHLRAGEVPRRHHV